MKQGYGGEEHHLHDFDSTLPFRVLLIAGDSESAGKGINLARNNQDVGFGLILRDEQRRNEILLDILESVTSDPLPENLTLVSHGVPLPGVHWLHLPSDLQPGTATRNRYFGWSVHDRNEVERAEREGAAYLLLSPIFEPLSKESDRPPLGLQELSAICDSAARPVFALGGIDADSGLDALRAGAWGVAGVSLVDMPPDQWRRLLESLATPVDHRREG